MARNTWMLFMGALALGLTACDEETLITNNVDGPETNNSNNSNNNTSGPNNTIVGVECTDSSECTPPTATCQGTVAVSYTGNGLCSSETGICNFFLVTERVDCAANTQDCVDGACVDNACTDVECETPRSRCEGNTEVFYERPSSCQLPAGTCQDFETRFDCSTIGAECLIDGCYGACVGVDCNDPPAASCDGQVAATYGNGTCNPDDASCSYAETRTDCTEMDRVCRNGSCVSDLCAGVTCDDPPAASCQGTVAVTYSGAGTCNPADGVCDYSGTEVMTDCATGGQLCAQGMCVNDPCDGVTCPQPADICDGNEAKVYSGEGVCDPADGMCDYSAVEVVTPCNALTCVDAACLDVTPAAGELVIQEIMHTPLAVADAAGEWFEIKNVSARPLNLDGLILESGGEPAYTAQFGGLNLLEPGELFVLGINSDMATNNGVSVDAAYTDLVLDATDTLEIRVGATVIDTLSWDSATTWPAGNGASMNFGAQHAPADNGDAANWCDSTTALGTDFGTPGAANIDCP